MKVIDFKNTIYFPWTIVFLGVCLLLASMFVIFESLIAGLALLFISFLIFTTHYRLSIDFEAKVFFDYIWILGMKSGSKQTFETIEYLFIKKNKTVQRMNHVVGYSEVRKEKYDGYIKFSETQKIHLLAKDSKEVLLTKLRPISKQLNLKIIDYSTGVPVEI
ncbi:hypothetical protein [Ohtaekwangia koreensis]|uniref:Uncharacterized protein n=1 Tax=Ohtaekwangia koreensis TaxID=688867 RepID=A0A1T5MGB5_9BACT|nr:hypothetical protein [Ohtaekwangia koreensis]SKC87252.1 hypothetical protein SAMN05660236_5365 [Ohtaekwangia koreensis]